MTMAKTKTILAITACPTGIAHTYMAAENLSQAAEELGYELKVETHGSVGVENPFSQADIDAADAIVVAADKQIDLSRFQGIPAVVTGVNEGIRNPKGLLERTANATPLAGDKPNGTAATATGTQSSSTGANLVYKALMNGVSHMIPFVVAGGLLIAIALSIGGEPTQEGLVIPEGSFWATISAVGALAFTLMVPILSGYIAMAIADRPGLAPGMITGYIAISGELYHSEAGAGFLGGIITGFASGYLALALKKIPVHRYVQPIMPIIIIPVVTTLLVALAFIYIIGAPVAGVFEFLTTWLAGMQGSSVILLGAILGAMAGFDMGGPVNKTAFLFSGGLIASGNAFPMGMMAAAIATPPLGMGLATLLRRSWFSKQEAESGIAALFMGFFGITEGAIPFAAARPLQIIPANVIGGAVAGGVAGAFAVQDHVMHGGPIVAVLGAVDNVAGFFIAIAVGTVVTAAVALGLMSLQRRSTPNQPSTEAAPAVAPQQPAQEGIADLLADDAVVLDTLAASKEDIIHLLAEHAMVADKVHDVGGAVAAALVREAKFSTAVGNGIAIPHLKDDAVSTPFIAFARVIEGLEWDAPDNQPVHLVFLLGVPASNTGNQHLKILAQLSRALMKPPVREALLQAKTPQEVRAAVEQTQPAG
ncbi:fructose-specific PTS transporter subunit EIIC [Corynebacterium pelargi]|uniref:PTS system mannose-specific EIIBCA component n=1 Tax=Corynebacterium pelargi TaxID=1471400 RepID=A0A410WAS0_9CORY|nr:fructose-specific PTS transporter subunit EIIC [Corynebacterium pelargi]QAU53030.1 PTS system mannose-specific EIIBCA component [Corynebacterium pelargi]